MWNFILPALSFYVVLFYKEALNPALAFPLFIFLIILSIKVRRIALFSLYATLLFLLVYPAYFNSLLSTALCESEVVALYGYVASPKSTRNNRDAGFRLEATAAVDKKGSVFSAKGITYVISDITDVGRGDKVRIDGEFRKEGYFLSESTAIIKRSPFGRLRSIVLERLHLFFSSESGALSSLLLLGNDENGNLEIKELAKCCGLSHLLALSGMHLAILSSIVEKPLSKLFGRRLGSILSLAILVFFSYLSSWRPSLFRALLFKLLSKWLRVEDAFVFSEVALLSLMPDAISDLGAAFSFVSLSGILFLSPLIKRRLEYIFPMPEAIGLSLSQSAAAIIFSVPLAFSFFGQYQLFAIISGIFMTAMISMYMTISLLSIALPFLVGLLDAFYGVILSILVLLAQIKPQATIEPYLYLVAALLSYLAIVEAVDFLISKKRKASSFF